MTEEAPYKEENFNLSYPSHQKELCRAIIFLRASNQWGLCEIAQKTGIAEESLNKMELGDERITLLDFFRILDACGVFKNLKIGDYDFDAI